ncbi:mlrC [Symbiodinium natans]|uniref:MlrC protein n=1 Tax=Symbiodinium natans TaxID=878477 RepID=A0A812NV34_9DINO|nr:mlrC [Symbiodinium natans]
MAREGRFRVAVGGFQHETNVFSTSKASYDDFLLHDGWPGLTRGGHLFETMCPINLPIGGFINAGTHESRAGDFHLEPLLWCSAEPCAHVETVAYDKISGMLCEDLESLMGGGLDGVYLDLHGAMVTEDFDDGEAELLRRIRRVIGYEVLLVVSLDWHANLSEEAFNLADAITIFRTYPHIDMAETGERCFALLEHMLTTRTKLHKTWRKVPYLIPLTAQYSEAEPARSLCAEVVAAASRDGMLSADFAPGFPASDGHSCHPSIVCFAKSSEKATEAADYLLSKVLQAEKDWTNDLLLPEAAIETALSMDGQGKPVVVADVQDNTGAGATSDTVVLLECMVRLRAPGAVALICDAAAVRAAEKAGEGRIVRLRLGGSLPGHRPLDADFIVERITPGRFACTGAMMRGTEADLDGTVLLRVQQEGGGGPRVVVSGRKFQCLDQAVFTHVGIEPVKERILVVKSSVHFHADFDPLAAAVLLAEAPGESVCRNERLPLAKLAPDTRLSPLGPTFAQWQQDGGGAELQVSVGSEGR